MVLGIRDENLMGHTLGMVILMSADTHPQSSQAQGKRCVLGPVEPGSGQRAPQSTAPEPTGREEGDPSQGSALFKAFELLMGGVFRGRCV